MTKRQLVSWTIAGWILLLVGLVSDPAHSKPIKGAQASPKLKIDNSGSTELDYIKGKQLVLDGRLEEAVPFFESALKREPNDPFLNHQLAEIQLRLGAIEKAEEYGKKAVAGEADNVEYLSTLGAILASEKRYDEAKDQYRKILVLDKENMKAPLLLGMLEAESGNSERGAEVLTKAIQENPDNYMALFYRAKIQLESNNIEKAQEDLDRCLQLRPSFVEAGTALGLLYERLGENENAIKAYSRIQANGRFKKRLAQLYLQQNELDKALEELIEYEEVEPDDYTARVKIALIQFELKRYDKAIVRFEKILKEQPEADNVRFYLGAVYEEQKQYAKAAQEYKRVSSDSTFFKEAMLHLGYVFRSQNRNVEGLQLAKKLVSAASDVVEYYDMQASFHDLLGDTKAALTVLEKGLKRFEQDERLLYFQAALLEKSGKRDIAIRNMKQILSKNPNNPHALNFLGYTYADSGENLEEAEKLVRHALTIRPGDAFIEDSLGWVLFKREKTEEGLAFLERASAKQPDEAIILEHLGDVYTAKKNFEKALDCYRRAQRSARKDEKELSKKLVMKISKLENDPLAKAEKK